jgi:branched-chain amino acid transport system substrate-binding protein
MKIAIKRLDNLKLAIAGAIVIAGMAIMGATAQEKPTYKIAYIGPITGPNTSIGVGTMNSMELAIRQANASGKLPFKLEFVSETDDSKPAAGVAAVQKICGDKNFIAVSAHWNSPVAMATGPYFNDCNLLNLIAGASANNITKQGWRAVGRIVTPFRYNLPRLASAAYEDLGLRKIAIVNSLDDFGNDTANQFADAFTKLGGQIIFRDGYNVGDRDFTSLLTKVRASRPEAVMHAGVSTEAALIIRQMRQLGMKQPYLGHTGFQSIAYIDAAGKYGNGTLLATAAPFPEELPGGKQFLADYAAAGFKDPPDIYGVFGYAAGQVIVELIKRYGPDRKAIVENFRNAKNIETIFGNQSFDADGELQPKRPGLAVLQDGKWMRFDKSEYKKKYMK